MRQSRTGPGWSPAVAGIATFLALTFLGGALEAAPAPLPRPARVRPLRPGDLIGTWSMKWNGIKGTVTLAGDGGYSCVWCGVKFVGTWKIDPHGRLWIQESYGSSQVSSGHGYAVRLDAGTLSGQVESGCDPCEVLLERRH